MGRRDPLPADALTGVHVLIVDDDPDARDLIGTVLQYCGALVSAVAVAVDALALVERTWASPSIPWEMCRVIASLARKI